MWPFTRKSDAGLTETYPPIGGKKPIRVTKISLTQPCTVWHGDGITATFTDEEGRRTNLPTHYPTHGVCFDHGLKIEVEDEFGVDVGVGWMLGGKRL